MASANIDVSKFLPADNFEASIAAVEKKCSDTLLLTMLEDGLHADITFKAPGGTVKAHRSVLGSVSSVFEDMFQDERKERLTSGMDGMPDMSIDSLQLFLLLLYITNERTQTMPEFDAAVDMHFNDLYDAAQKFQVVSRLNPVLTAGLLRHLTPENCWDYYHKSKSSKLLSEHNFPEDCWGYIMKNYEMVMKSASTVLEMRRDPKLVQRCIIEATSKGLCCVCKRQLIIPQRK